MEINQPTTPTNTSGKEAIRDSNAQGSVIGDGVTDRVLIGFQKNGFGTGSDYGIKVSQPGFDVKSATDSQLVMSSGFNMFKIAQVGTASVTTSAAGLTTTTVSHSLGFGATLFAWLNTSFTLGQYRQIPVVANSYSAGVITTDWIASAYVTTSSIVFEVTTRSTSFNGTYIFKYYLMQETAA